MSVHLFYGEEAYLLETRLKKLKKEFGEQIQGINYIQIDDTNVNNIISDLETPAFGFNKKLIIAKNTGLFKKEKKLAGKTKSSAKLVKEDKKAPKDKISMEEKLPLQDKIADYLQNNISEINDTIDLIFVEEVAEKNTLYQTIEKIGEVKEFVPLKLPEIIASLKKVSMAYQVTIDDSTARYLVECCGTNMQDLINEIRKLIEFAGSGGTITKQDVDKLCIKQIQAVIFDLTDNLGKREMRKSLKCI